ncbi:MAG: hypothetical protein HC911_16340 [Chloroflexaceae bacterium]|nr:hypothetical protein [Chloroflexaceae bacterium]
MRDYLPSVADYKRGLQKLDREKRIAENHRNMLIAHYNAPNHTITATALAQEVGYKRFTAVNLQYGTFGKKLREVMNWSGPGQESHIIASFYQDETGEWLWIMHDNLAQALKELRWVR